MKYILKLSYGYIGLVLFGASWVVLFNITEPTNLNLTFAYTLFMLGSLLFFDWLSRVQGGPSIAKLCSTRLIVSTVIVTTIVGIFLELYAHWLGKMWFYPYWDFSMYLMIFIPGYVLYILYLLTAYNGLMACIKNPFLPVYTQDTSTKKQKGWSMVLISGAGLAVITGILVYVERDIATAFVHTNLPFDRMGHFLFYFGAPFFVAGSIYGLGILFKKAFAVPSIAQAFFLVVGTLLLAAASAVLLETFNAYYFYWRYDNIPFEHIELLGTPMVMILLWFLQYVVIIPLMQLFGLSNYVYGFHERN